MKQRYIYITCLDAYGDILLCCWVLSDLWSQVCLHPITNDQMGVSEQQHSLYRGSVKAHTCKHIHKHTAIQHMAWDSTCKHVQALPRRRTYTHTHPSNHGETKKQLKWSGMRLLDMMVCSWELTRFTSAIVKNFTSCSQRVIQSSLLKLIIVRCVWNCILWPKCIVYTNLEENTSIWVMINSNIDHFFGPNIQNYVKNACASQISHVAYSHCFPLNVFSCPVT